MSTIDLLFSYSDEATALAALAGTPYVNDGAWNTSVVFPGLRLIVTPAAYDAEGAQVTPETLLNDQFWLLVSVTASSPPSDLTALEACRMAANREAAAAGQPFIYQAGLRADPAQIASVTRIDGLPAGSAYPIQNPMVIT